MENESCLLKNRSCIPCRGGVPSLKGDKLNNLQKELGNNWRVISEHHLYKEFKFNDFKCGLEFTNKVGHLSEEQGHHPEIHLSWGKVKIIIFTHKIDGLTDSDFILAAKIDECFNL